ncbi:MAG: hypothetical protein ACE15E_19295 [Acidobacteriota bacterium]
MGTADTMNDPKLQTFRLPFSPDGMGFGTLVIDAQAVESSAEGGDIPLPLRCAKAEVAPGEPAALVFSTPAFTPGAASAAVHADISPQLGAALPDEPVGVEIALGPSEASDGTQFTGGEVIKRCQVRVSDTQIDWDTEPAHFKQGDRIVIPADGRTEFTLIVRARRLIPGQGVIPDDDKVEFTHMLQPGSFAPPIKDVFAPVERPAERREERSKWRSVRALPDPSRNIQMPAQCYIRVKAWSGPDGAVTRIDWEKVSIKPNAQLKDLVMIPVILAEPKVKVELLEPPAMPIPANGELQELTLQLTWDLGEASGPAGENRASGLEITVEQKEDPAGRFESKYEQPSQPSDAEGKVSFKYTPPVLTFRPGGRYYEDFNVYTGKGDARRKIGECRITLSPEIRIRFTGEKQREHKGAPFGLVFDAPREVTIPAEKRVQSIKGTARLQFSDMTGGEKVLPVAGAKIKVEHWNGTEFVASPSGLEFETDGKGCFAWDIKELIGPSGKREDSTYTLDEDREDPLAALNDKAEELIALYEDKINLFCPFSILSADLGDRIKKYRLVFTEQLAGRKVADFIKIISGTEALRAAACYAHSYNEFYENVARIVVEQFRDLFMALIEVGLAFFNVADKIAKAIGNRLAALGQSSWMVWLRNNVGTPIYTRCQAMAHWLAEQLQRLSRAPSPSGAPLSAWEQFIVRILGQARQVLQETELIPLITGVFSVIGQFVFGLVGNWFKQNLYKLPLVIIGRVANLFFGATSRELMERWVSQIIEDTIKLILDALQKTATEVQAGRRPVLDFARLFNIFVPAAEAALNDVHQAASQLNVPEDYEPRQDDLKNGFAALRDAGLTWELEGIQNDEAMEFISLTMTYVQYFLIAVATFTTAIGGAAVAAATRGISIAWGALRGVIRVFGPLRCAIASAVTITAHYRVQVTRLIR